MRFMNPYVGLKRDDAGYYLDVNEAAASPFYSGNNSARRDALLAASRGGRVDIPAFNPYAADLPKGVAMPQQAPDNLFKVQSFGRADQQYQTDKDVARRASEDQQRGGTTPGGPDVQLTTGGDNGDALDDEGKGGTRRRRGAFQGSGLKI